MGRDLRPTNKPKNAFTTYFTMWKSGVTVAIPSCPRRGPCQQDSGDDHQGHAAQEPWLSRCQKLRSRLPAQAYAEKSQINCQDRSRRQPQSNQMEGLDQRKQPGRLPDRLPNPRAVAPLKEGQHQYSEGLGTQLVRKLTIAACGCRSQSNQL